jgi:hypothetical protein
LSTPGVPGCEPLVELPAVELPLLALVPVDAALVPDEPAPQEVVDVVLDRYAAASARLA